MKILLTGASGFVASYIAVYLKQRGHDIFLTLRDRSKAWRLGDLSGYHIYEGDLFDETFAEDVVEQTKPDALIHCAWSGVHRDGRNSDVQPKNILMTQVILQAVVENKCPLFIGLGTQAEYGVHNRRIDENVEPVPLDNYGRYKLASGLLGQMYANKHEFRYAWLRLFSTFGPKDNDSYIIPFVIQSLLKNETPKLTDCEQMWDYLYVKDIPKLIELVLNKEEYFCGLYNLCSGQPQRLKDVVQSLDRMIDGSVHPQFGAIAHRPQGLMHLEGDNTKFKNEFGSLVLTDIEQALQETVQWYRN